MRARQTQALDDTSRFIRVGQIAAGLFFAMLLLFAVPAPISGATVAAGEVTTSSVGVIIQPASGTALQPGLPVSVTGETESRMLLDYLFAPLGDAFSGAFREE